MLRSDRVLAVLSGFEPGKTSGVGTFYDFIDRFWPEDDDVQSQRRKRLRKPFRKPSKRLKAWYWRTHFAAMNQHLDAWVEQSEKMGFDIWPEVLAASVKAA